MADLRADLQWPRGACRSDALARLRPRPRRRSRASASLRQALRRSSNEMAQRLNPTLALGRSRNAVPAEGKLRVSSGERPLNRQMRWLVLLSGTFVVAALLLALAVLSTGVRSQVQRL